MTSLHALDHIRQSFNGSTDRTARAGIGQFLTPAAIAQFMASLFEDGHQHVRVLDPGAGAGRGPALLPIACNEWFKAQRFKSAYYLYAVMNAAKGPQLYMVRDPAKNLAPEERVEVVRYVVSSEQIKTRGETSA